MYGKLTFMIICNNNGLKKNTHKSEFSILITYIYIYQYMYIFIDIWISYNDLTVLPNPGIMVNKGNHPQMALIQVSEILSFTQIIWIMIRDKNDI